MTDQRSESGPHARLLDIAVAVYEPDDDDQSQASAAVLGLGYKLCPRGDERELVKLIAGPSMPAIAVLAVPGAEAIVEAAVALSPARPVVVGSVAGPAATARARSGDCDLFTIKPHTIDSLAPVLHAAATLAAQRERMRALEGNEKRLRDRLAKYGRGSTATGFQHFDFFQHHLVMEIKRARRFGYALAICLVGLDPLLPKTGPDDPESAPESAIDYELLHPHVVESLRRGVAQAISSVIRDVDSPVEFAEDRFLVFLPYTESEAAEQTGQRIVLAVRGCELIRHQGRVVRPSVSIGIAATEKGQTVSFARMVRDAAAAMRAAQLKGGDRVVLRR